MRIDTHHHLLPGVDDGCRHRTDTVANARLLLEHGYSRVFCTPHFGRTGFNELDLESVKMRVREVRKIFSEEGILLQVRPGGELRLDPELPQTVEKFGVPTFGHNTKHVLVDLFHDEWPEWATRGVEFLIEKGYTVTLAHPERMEVLINKPAFVEEFVRMGLRLQGTLGPLANADRQPAALLAERLLKDGRYWLLGSDGHRPEALAVRLTGLERAVEFVGEEEVRKLTVTNPAELWV